MSYDRGMDHTPAADSHTDPVDAASPSDVAGADDEVTIALTPPQLAIVVVVVALIVVWLLRRKRRSD